MCRMQKLRVAAKEVDEQQSQIFRLEVRLAEANKKLEHTADLEKELLHYRSGCQLCIILASAQLSECRRSIYRTCKSESYLNQTFKCKHQLASIRTTITCSGCQVVRYLCANFRKLAKDAEKKGQGGLWGYISGS